MKPKIALVTDSYAPVRNGVAVAVAQLRNYLIRSGYSVVVVAPSGTGTRTKFLVPSCRVPGIHPYVATGLGFRSCLRALRQFDPDIVHVHGWGPVSLLGIHFARRTATPLVVTWHTDVRAYFDYYRRFLPLLLGWQVVVRLVCNARLLTDHTHPADRFTTAILEVADLVIAPSEKVSDQLRKLAPDRPMTTLPVGVDPIPPASAGHSVLSGINGAVLLYVGRIAPEKGIDLLLDAYEILRKRQVNATLVLVGDYRSSRGLRKRLRNAQGIVLTGELDRMELANIYTQADLFVFPSSTDTQGLVLHEAAHAGLPMVVVDSKLHSVVTDERNTTFCAPEPAALADALLRTFGNQEDRARSTEIARAGKALASRRSVEHQCDELSVLYLQLLRGDFE
ncbi:glycosyltransferase [Amycolatopsis japonica]|uniref:glycosyltransferase n=1 Tax=Amycolatopsis japonica TaxID=208439 RepID=UPI003793A07E